MSLLLRTVFSCRSYHSITHNSYNCHDCTHAHVSGCREVKFAAICNGRISGHVDSAECCQIVVLRTEACWRKQLQIIRSGKRIPRVKM